MTRQSDWNFADSFAWIYNHNKEIIGAGFLIGWEEIATCAHVVRDVFGLECTPNIAPKGDIALSFPSSEQNLLATAHADGWDKQKDIAILQLHTELPKGPRPAKLSANRKLKNHSFIVYGFPGKTAKGVWAYGLIKDQRENGLVQLESATGYAVQRGFSGGPVFDDDLKKVVGMIVTSDESVRVASMIPVDVLAGVCSRAGVNFELDEVKGGDVMNISPREICENCLKASFSGMQKQELISIAKNRIPDVGRKLDDMRSIDWMFNIVLDYCGSHDDYDKLWDIIKDYRKKQYDKFYPEWEKATIAI